MRPLVVLALWAIGGGVLAIGCGTHVDEQRLGIGSACNTSGQCGTGKFFCDLSHANGYCKADCRKDADCPPGAVCVGAGLILSGACAATCASAADCRAGDVCLAGDASASYCDQPPLFDGGSD
jgi:hypothetical protein